ncbi:hypothetical protein ABK040_005751 [Willaertia magna]
MGFTKQDFKRHLVTIILYVVTLLFLAFEFAVPFIFRSEFCPAATTSSDDPCSGMYWLHMSPFFIVSVLTLLSLGIGLCQKVVGFVLYLIITVLHIGGLVFYILFFITGSVYKTQVEKHLFLKIVPPVALGLATICCIICMLDACRHVFAKKFGGEKEELTTDYVPLQGSRRIDSDSDDSD